MNLAKNIIKPAITEQNPRQKRCCECSKHVVSFMVEICLIFVSGTWVEFGDNYNNCVGGYSSDLKVTLSRLSFLQGCHGQGKLGSQRISVLDIRIPKTIFLIGLNGF